MNQTKYEETTMSVNCETNKYVGRVCAMDVYFANACPSTRPDSADFVPIGAMTTKSFTLSGDEVDGTADDNTDNVKQSIMTFLNYETSGDGKCRKSDGALSNHAGLVKYFATEMSAGRQPWIWVRQTFPDITITAFCQMTDPGSRSAPDGDLVTYSFAAKATSSDFGVIVEDTPVT